MQIIRTTICMKYIIFQFKFWNRMYFSTGSWTYKRFASSYGAKVGVRAKKKWKRESEGRRGNSPLPLLCSRPNFLDERARKRLLRSLLWGAGGAYEWGRGGSKRQVTVYMLTIHYGTVHLRLGSWFIRNRHSIDWSVRVICVAGVWTWWWSY